jgi:hypothetical protein
VESEWPLTGRTIAAGTREASPWAHPEAPNRVRSGSGGCHLSLQDPDEGYPCLGQDPAVEAQGDARRRSGHKKGGEVSWAWSSSSRTEWTLRIRR